MDAMLRTSSSARTFANGTIRWPGWACALLLAAGFVGPSSALIGQVTQATDRASSPLKQHYDAAFRFQDAGDAVRANSEYKIYVSMVLHRIANGSANLGNYAHAVQIYGESLRLAPEPIRLDSESSEPEMVS